MRSRVCYATDRSRLGIPGRSTGEIPPGSTADSRHVLLVYRGVGGDALLHQDRRDAAAVDRLGYGWQGFDRYLRRVSRQEIRECEMRIESEQAATDATKQEVEGLQKEIGDLEKELTEIGKKVEEYRQRERRRKPTKFKLED